MPDPTPEDAETLLEKLRVFTLTLEPAQRAMLAILLTPGIDAAWGVAGTDEHAPVPWHGRALVGALVNALGETSRSDDQGSGR